jgi:hypothetical protein
MVRSTVPLVPDAAIPGVLGDIGEKAYLITSYRANTPGKGGSGTSGIALRAGQADARHSTPHLFGGAR